MDDTDHENGVGKITEDYVEYRWLLNVAIDSPWSGPDLELDCDTVITNEERYLCWCNTSYCNGGNE
jgi:hypothetical protein